MTECRQLDRDLSTYSPPWSVSNPLEMGLPLFSLGCSLASFPLGSAVLLVCAFTRGAFGVVPGAAFVGFLRRAARRTCFSPSFFQLHAVSSTQSLEVAMFLPNPSLARRLGDPPFFPFL